MISSLGGYVRNRNIVNRKKKRFFTNNLHHHQQLIVLGSQKQKELHEILGEPLPKPQIHIPPTPAAIAQANVILPRPLSPIASRQDDAIYWSEYRRSYEEGLRQKMQQQRQAQAVILRASTPVIEPPTIHEVQPQRQLMQVASIQIAPVCNLPPVSRTPQTAHTVIVPTRVFPKFVNEPIQHRSFSPLNMMSQPKLQMRPSDLSVEQLRYQNRIRQAAQRQRNMDAWNLDNRQLQTEKDRFVSQLEHYPQFGNNPSYY